MLLFSFFDSFFGTLCGEVNNFCQLTYQVKNGVFGYVQYLNRVPSTGGGFYHSAMTWNINLDGR